MRHGQSLGSSPRVQQIQRPAIQTPSDSHMACPGHIDHSALLRPSRKYTLRPRINAQPLLLHHLLLQKLQRHPHQMTSHLGQLPLRFLRTHPRHQVSMLDILRQKRIIVAPRLDRVVGITMEQLPEHVGVACRGVGPARPQGGIQRVLQERV